MAKFCTACGGELQEGIAFCTHCGAKAGQAAPNSQMPQMQPPSRSTAQAATRPAPQPAREQPQDNAVGTGAFFGLILLFSLPVIGWLVCIILAFSAKNRNIRNFSRAMLIWLVIALVIGIVAGFAVKALVSSVTGYLEQTAGELGILGSAGDLGQLGELGNLGELSGLLQQMENMGG